MVIVGSSQDIFRILLLLLLCYKSLFHLPYISCQVLQLLNTETLGDRVGDRQHGAFYLDPNDDVEQTGVMRMIYYSGSSFCMLAFSVRKIDGFIMLLHCVHVWVYRTMW